MDFAVPDDYFLKLKIGEKRDKYMELAKEWKKKIMEYESDGDTNCNSPKIGTGSGGLGNKRMSGDNLNNSIVEIGQNIEKCPGDWRRLAARQTPVRNYKRTLV